MTDDASEKVSDANAGEKSRMADREGHGAVNSSHDRASAKPYSVLNPADFAHDVAQLLACRNRGLV